MVGLEPACSTTSARVRESVRSHVLPVTKPVPSTKQNIPFCLWYTLAPAEDVTMIISALLTVVPGFDVIEFLHHRLVRWMFTIIYLELGWSLNSFNVIGIIFSLCRFPKGEDEEDVKKVLNPQWEATFGCPRLSASTAERLLLSVMFSSGASTVSSIAFLLCTWGLTSARTVGPACVSLPSPDAVQLTRTRSYWPQDF